MTLAEELAGKCVWGDPEDEHDGRSVQQRCMEAINEALERAAQAVLAGQKQEASGDCTSHANWELRFAAKRIRALKGE